MNPRRTEPSQTDSVTEALEVERLPAGVAALLGRLARELAVLYGDRYRGLVLYGSYARGEADEGSDVDLLLLLEREVDPARELLRAEEVKWPLSVDAGYTVSLLPVGVEAFQHPKQPYLRNAREEGIPLT